jgi:ketosteroid isomerase-like protein
MSQENVEVIRTVFDQFARGDFGRWFALTTDDFEFVTSPDIPDAGTYYGEEARRWITAWARSFEGHTMEAEEIIEAGGDNVIAGYLQRGHPGGSESAVEGRWWLVVTFRQGAIAPHRELPPSLGSPRSRRAVVVESYRFGRRMKVKSTLDALPPLCESSGGRR